MTTGRSREFRLLNYYLGNEWAKDLSERNSIVYFELLAEVSLFVSVLVKAAREAHASTGNVPQWLREGQLVLDHLQFEKVSLGAGSVTIEARRDYPPAEKPEFTQWIWSRQLRSVSLVSGQYKCNPTTNERVIWLPYLNLNQVPSAVLSRMAPWLEVDATGAVLLESAYWYDYRSGQSISTNYNTHRGLSLFIPHVPEHTRPCPPKKDLPNARLEDGAPPPPPPPPTKKRTKPRDDDGPPTTKRKDGGKKDGDKDKPSQPDDKPLDTSVRKTPTAPNTTPTTESTSENTTTNDTSESNNNNGAPAAEN